MSVEGFFSKLLPRFSSGFTSEEAVLRCRDSGPWLSDAHAVKGDEGALREPE